jgi:hypothetical protein
MARSMARCMDAELLLVCASSVCCAAATQGLGFAQNSREFCEQCSMDSNSRRIPLFCCLKRCQELCREVSRDSSVAAAEPLPRGSLVSVESLSARTRLRCGVCRRCAAARRGCRFAPRRDVVCRRWGGECLRFSAEFCFFAVWNAVESFVESSLETPPSRSRSRCCVAVWCRWSRCQFETGCVATYSTLVPLRVAAGVLRGVVVLCFAAGAASVCGSV